MLKKFKFYLIGLVPGLLIVFFILNKKGASCSGYLPNSRVIAETLSKDFQYAPAFEQEMKENKIDEKFLRENILTIGEINFDKSHPQQKPCPDYYLVAKNEKGNFAIVFQKCEEEAKFLELKKVNE